ncbi:MAG: ribonuclease III domain-containing protein [Eubacteriales bacterium]|nr:ribonuclease III domain-containing protein [Eubacteriales bacterium]
MNKTSNLNALQLAYIGDAVYDLLVREFVLNSNKRLNDLHRAETGLVCAPSQAKIYSRLFESLTEEEKQIAKRGRNAQPKHRAPKAASSEEYASSTALEAVFGFLYLNGNIERIQELFSLCINQNEEA